MGDYEIFELGQVALQCGLTLPQGKLAYKTYGEISAARDNVIVMPTFYGAQHAENDSEQDTAQVAEKIWLPPRDSNPDMLIQSQLSCR